MTLRADFCTLPVVKSWFASPLTQPPRKGNKMARSRNARPAASSTLPMHALADLFALLPLVRRVDAVTIEWISPTMRHAVRVLNSLSAMSSLLR